MKPLRLSIWAALFGILALFGTGAAQAPQAVIVVESWSPQELHDLGWTSHPSTGLKVVGVEEQVYLLAKESAGQEITSVAWTLTTKPNGSTATLDSTTSRRTTFKPDVEGQFVIDVQINTAGGSATASVTITSAKYVGVGTVGGATPNVVIGQCGLCHSANTEAWSQTGHATLFEKGIDGLASDHYNEACIECHTVGFFADVHNGGFWDVANQLGWQFPDTLQPGNWDDIVANFPALAAVSNIQCESCHGPGSQHKGVKSKTEMSLDEGVCGRCHEEAPYHRISTQWKNSVHGIPNAEFESVANRPASSGCAKCHSGWGFIRRVDVRTPDTRPEIGSSQISCAVCHDPHRSELPHQVRTLDNVQLGDTLTVVNYGGMGKVCMQCHISRRDAADYVNNPNNLSTHFGPHYSNQADMVDGSNAIEYGLPTGSSGHKFALADACVACHMQPTPEAGQPGHDKVGSHTFAMRDDNGTPDDHSDDIEHVAVCQTCHGPMQSFDDILAKADWDDDGTIESSRHEIEGLLHRLEELLPPHSTTAEVNANFKWTASDPPEKIEARKLLAKAWFNFLFVEEDRSFGAHNAAYSINILRRSIASLTTGDIGAAEIISIADVPNDQGKQVRLAWDGFPGDGISSDPVESYSLWRRVDDVVGKTSAEALSKEELYAQATPANIGKRFFVINSGWWDFVDQVPASNLGVYSTVVPTLFDSTAAGIHWSYFYVAGHRSSGQTTETAPDSGYSIDNLAPEAPANVSGLERFNSIFLNWNASLDKDFNYFTLYRSTTSGFDPKSNDPLAQLTENNYQDSGVAIGTTYYYRVSAHDFSGNESAYSNEFSLLVTSVEGNGGVLPKEYALYQNYPNPFNPTTAIKFDLKASGNVVLSIYNMLGEEVMTLIDGHMEAGQHQWTVSADNLTSGVYFYKIQTNSYTAVKKMILMK
ncbi:MAG TPA: T9SS type A sorting domain-containing protein [bacterium]